MDVPCVIREASEKDIGDVSSLVERCIESSSRDFYTKVEKSYWASLYSREKFLEYAKGWKFWVLSLNGKIVGCAGLNYDEIKGIFVDPELQGKKLGWRLLSFVENHARSMGVKKLFLDSSLNAVGFYERCGYVFLEDKKYETYLQAGSLDVARMAKEI